MGSDFVKNIFKIREKYDFSIENQDILVYNINIQRKKVRDVFQRSGELEDLMRQPQELQRTEEYLAEKLGMFLRQKEPFLICFANERPDSIGSLLERAARRVGATPLLCSEDYRWKTLLKMAFDSRATAVAGPPLVVLGLTKLARITRTPLNFRHVLTAGYPCMDWMIYGIRRGLDCQTWGCFGPGVGAMVGGFSCAKSLGVHFRDDTFLVDIVDDEGKSLSPGTRGNVVLRDRRSPDVSLWTGDIARLDTTPCACGCASPRLMDLDVGDDADLPLLELAGELLSWSSILDCKIRRGDCGVELELVVFPGEKLPKLPTVAKQIIRPWDPETDKPFMEIPGGKIVKNG